MIFIEFLSRWLSRAAIDSRLDQLSKTEDSIDAQADVVPDRTTTAPPELRMDDSPPGYRIKWWV